MQKILVTDLRKDITRTMTFDEIKERYKLSEKMIRHLIDCGYKWKCLTFDWAMEVA